MSVCPFSKLFSCKKLWVVWREKSKSSWEICNGFGSLLVKGNLNKTCQQVSTSKCCCNNVNSFMLKISPRFKPFFPGCSQARSGSRGFKKCQDICKLKSYCAYAARSEVTSFRLFCSDSPVKGLGIDVNLDALSIKDTVYSCCLTHRNKPSFSPLRMQIMCWKEKMLDGVTNVVVFRSCWSNMLLKGKTSTTVRT